MSESTKKAIKESMKKLLTERSIDKITVRNITDDCGISRNTFYYHFADIPSLVDEILRDRVDQLIKSYPSIETLERGVEMGIRFIGENRAIALHLYGSTQRYVYERYLMAGCRHLAEGFLGFAIPPEKLTNGDREAMIDFYKCLIFGFIIDWCESGMDPDYMQTVNRLMELRRSFTELLTTYESE